MSLNIEGLKTKTSSSENVHIMNGYDVVTFQEMWDVDFNYLSCVFQDFELVLCKSK